MKRCSRCLLPETYPNIRYNGDGVCNYCLSYTPIEYKGEPKLEELLDTYLNRTRNKGEKYDCVVAVSGGRDSTFMLYELVEAYDMKVLAYNYDNGFVSEQAKLNLKRMTDALGVDLVTIKYDQTKYFRNNAPVA
jgi:tRNA(Ile)-lysidine synthase TilS/MesJ